MEEKKQKEIRKAYFSGTINKLLDKYAADRILEPEELKEIDETLEILQMERADLHQILSTYDLKEKEMMVLPGAEELMNMGEDKKQAIEKWEKEREVDYRKAQEIFSQAKNKALGANLDQYMEWGFELVHLQYNLDLYRIWKDQMYRAKIIKFVDTYGCSRAEAEERAKITSEYREYKKAVLFRELVQENIMLCKKKYSAFN